MLEGITWGQFFTVIGIVTTAYYLIVGLLYFRKEIIGKLLKRSSEEALPEHWKQVGKNQTDSEQAYQEFEVMVQEIRVGILERAGKGASKEQLLVRLRQTLASFGGLHHPAFRIALNNFLIQYGEQICGVVFTVTELDAEWDKLVV